MADLQLSNNTYSQITDLQSTSDFTLVIANIPSTLFYCQKVRLPSLTVQPISIPALIEPIKNPGNILQYGDLEIVFKTDASLVNYQEIQNWIINTVIPGNTSIGTISSNNNMKSAATLIMNDAKGNPSVFFKISACFPYRLSELVFDTTAQPVQWLDTTAAFCVQDFTIQNIAT